MKKTIVCTVCPSGCSMEAEYTTKEDIVVTGNRCPRGAKYCEDECFEPKRMFTDSVSIKGSSRRRMPVRTTGAIPKDKILECAAKVKEISLECPVKSQQVLVKDFMGTGEDLIATMTLA